MHTVFQINPISLSNILHWAHLIEFQFPGSENTVLYIEKLYMAELQNKKETYEIPPFSDNSYLSSVHFL